MVWYGSVVQWMVGCGMQPHRDSICLTKHSPPPSLSLSLSVSLSLKYFLAIDFWRTRSKLKKLNRKKRCIIKSQRTHVFFSLSLISSSPLFHFLFCCCCFFLFLYRFLSGECVLCICCRHRRLGLAGHSNVTTATKACSAQRQEETKVERKSGGKTQGRVEKQGDSNELLALKMCSADAFSLPYKLTLSIHPQVS